MLNRICASGSANSSSGTSWCHRNIVFRICGGLGSTLWEQWTMIGHWNCCTLEHCCSILRLIFSVGGVHFGKGTIMVDLVATWASVLWRSSIVDELLWTGVTVKLWEVLFVSLYLHSVGLWLLINDLVLLLNLALLCIHPKTFFLSKKKQV